ncbi:hypothetical protein BC835DRAFT_702928 [Cytidiella melzeri]|nr:hypothetical protein BC835DRAFT_702928 [Cytidiella melzeri]
MASRRLTISSLLCSDDLPPSPVAGPSYSPPFDSGPSRASTNSPRRHTPHSELLRYAEEDVVPLSFQPALHLRRRTPSPSPPSYASPLTGSSGSRRSFKEIAFDNHQGQQPVSVTNSSTFNYAGRTARSQSSRPDSPHASMVRTSSNTVHRSPPHMYTVSESPQTHHSPQRLPFGVPTDHVRSPRHLNSSVHALMNSSTQSYVGVYNLQRRSSSRSDVNVSPAPLDAQASFAPSPPAPRPSASPVQSLHRSSYSSNVSSTYSTNSAPQVSSPASSSSSQRPHSRHAIASLLTDSPSVSRPSAASLPHILNSPTQSRSPAATSSSVQGVGMEGLEALVQAATQERRRLGGEVYSEGVAVDAHPVNRSSRSSPFAERGESNSHLSPLSERGGFHHGRLSPAVDRAAINQTKSPFMQHSTLYPSPPTRNTPLQSPMRLPSSSLHLTRAVGTLPVPLHPQPEHHFVQRPHSPPFHEREGQPPPKRRRGSEGVAIVAHSPKHSRQTSFASSSSQDSPPSIHLPPKTEPSLEYSSRVVPAFPPSSPSAKPLTSSAHYVDMQDVGLATPMVDVKVEDLTSSVDLEKPSHSSVEPSSVRIQSPSRGRILPTAVEGDMSHQHPSPIALEPHIEADHPDAEAKLHRQDIVAQRRDDAKHSGSVKKKTRLSHKEKVDKPAKVIRHEHVPSGKSGLQISLEHVETTQDDDPYDWLMEHYGGASSAPTHHPVVRNKEKSPDFRPVLPKNDHSRDSHSIVGSSARLSVQPAKAVMKESKIAHHPPPTRSPSPIATLEEEIGAAEEHLPIRATTTLHRGSVHGQQGGKATPDIDMDLEAELDFVAGPRGTNRDMKHKSDASELDVEDELLSLLDDMPHPRRASTHVHPRPDMLKALSPLPTANAVSEQALTHVNIIRPKSSAKSTSKPDCESMPPPQTSDPAQAREESTSSKKGEASVFASMKKKDGAAKVRSWRCQ